MSEDPDDLDSQLLNDAGEADDYGDIEDITPVVGEDNKRIVERNGSVEGNGFSENLNAIEEQVIRSVQELGIEYRGLKPPFMLFERQRTIFGDLPRLRETAIPRASVPDLARQLGNKIVNYPTILGFMIPALGYSEMVFREYGKIGISALEKVLFSYTDAPDCQHQGLAKQLPAVPFRSFFRGEGNVISPRLHIRNSDRPTCIEVSNASPLALLFYVGVPSYRVEPRFFPTLKIDLGKDVDEESIIRITEDLVRSLIYEFDVRNGLILDTQARPLLREARALVRRRGPHLENVRYPKIHIQHEVADLFNFAGQARDNPPLAFLSYYQTLEYFIPTAVRQNALKRIRRELHDPTFDEDSDKCLMRIISATERSVNIPEAGQVRTLVNEFVRKDRLEEFFHQEWNNYFTRRGPVQGVTAINVGDTTNLCDQVADRIYQIRNRIVHAKDDPRYQDARVLLPQSQEAQSLKPDVELVRLLAMEAILSSQG